jgi:CheY-like chemotaxis protein
MRRRGKLLVVMEQGAIRRLLAEALSLMGYEVEVTGEWPDDPRLPDGERPSLVLYDVSMPAALGRETLRRIREWDEEARIVAFSDPATGGAGEHEPALMVIRYGQGRVFHTILGHGPEAMRCVGFIVTFQRGAQWAAIGKVAQKVPKDFPTADRVSVRE